jgi:hypothetical protein
MRKDYRKYAPFLLVSSNRVAFSNLEKIYTIEELNDFFAPCLVSTGGSEFDSKNNNGIEYIVVPSWSNPRWFIPKDKYLITHIGNLVKPTSFAAKTIWKIALCLNKINCIDWLFRSKIYINTNHVGAHFFKTNDSSRNRFVVYTGAKGIYQKFTFQEMDEKKEIISFIKVGKNKFTSFRLENEVKILKILGEKRFFSFDYPALVDYYQKDGFTFLKQTPCKKEFSRVLMDLTDLHLRFLSEVHQSCHKSIYTEEFLSSIEEAIENLSHFDKNACEILVDAIRILKITLNRQKLLFVLSHGDFTAWNCFSNKKILYVFDWEMGEYRMPLWDYFNFIYHSVLLTVGYKVKAINKKLCTNTFWAKSLVGSDLYDTCHLTYLIEITIHYLQQCQELSRHGMRNNVFMLVQNFSKSLKMLIINHENSSCQ